MKSYALNAEPRTDLGKKATKALRAESKIPAVLNGGEVVTLPFAGTLKPGQKVVEIAENKTSNEKKGIIVTDLSIKLDDVRKLIYTPDIFVIELSINGEAKKAVLKDIQFHPVSDEILHIDLLEVYDNKPVVMEVPVKLDGHAVGVKAGGKLYLNLKKVKVKGLYNNIPERLVIDVTDINIGQSIKVGKLQFDNFELVSAKDLVIAGVRATRGSAAKAQTEDAE